MGWWGKREDGKMLKKRFRKFQKNMSFSRRPKEKQRLLCLSLMFQSCQSEQKFTNCRYKSLIKSESFKIKSYPRIFTKLEMWSWHQLSICPTRGPIHFKTNQGFQVCLDHPLHFTRIPQWSSEWNFIKPGWWLNQPYRKICASQNGCIFPKFRGENDKYLENHHLETQWQDELPHIAGIDKPGGAAPFNLHVDAGMDSYTNCNKQGTKKENLHNKKQFSDVNSQKQTLFEKKMCIYIYVTLGKL